MLKEIVEANKNEMYEMGYDEKLVYKRLIAATENLDKATNLAKKLKDGSRLKKVLDKIGGDIYEEMEFVGRGEYS